MVQGWGRSEGARSVWRTGTAAPTRRWDCASALESTLGKEERARGKQPSARKLTRPEKAWVEVPVWLDLEQGHESESPIS